MYPFREDEDQDLAPAAALQNMFHRILSARCVRLFFCTLRGAWDAEGVARPALRPQSGYLIRCRGPVWARHRALWHSDQSCSELPGCPADPRLGRSLCTCSPAVMHGSMMAIMHEGVMVGMMVSALTLMMIVMLLLLLLLVLKVVSYKS